MSVWKFIPPLAHRHARSLCSLRIDARRRNDVALRDDQERWLEAHLARCADCRAHDEGLQAAARALAELGRAAAPQGFAGRVLLAARARGKEALPAEPVRAPSLAWARPAAIAFAGAMALGGAWLLVGPKGAGRGHDTLISGSGSSAGAEAPHFTVRAPGMGAARARSQITAIVLEHGGTYSDQGGALLARIPRQALIGLTQDLARSGRFKMSRTDAGDVDPGAAWIVLRFELD